MKTTATVVSVKGTVALVETERLSACDGCHKKTEKGGCTVCTLMGGERRITAEAENLIGARVGDTVTVESAADRVLFYAALVFLMPLLTCLLGGVIAALITEVAGYRILGAVVGFVLWFPVLRWYSARVQKKRPDAVITEILKTSSRIGEDEI